MMEEKWTELFDELEDIVLLIDQEYHIRKINKRGQTLFNINQETISGHKCYDILWGKDSPCNFCPIHRSRKTGKPENTEQYLDVNDGKWFSIKTSPVFDRNNHLEGYIDILRDISDLKETEEKLKEINEEYLALNEELTQTNEELYASKERAEESDKLKSAFLANMSHEIRTPMNAILGFSELLNNPEISAIKRTKYTSVINETANQLLHIINDVLDISKIESGNIQIEQKPFNLYQALNDVFNVYQPQVSEKVKISLNYNLNKDLSLTGDKNRISQILHNLLSNAVKFTDQGQINLDCSLENNTVKLRVKDTGRGIMQENLSRVFERFWQEKTKLEENKGGTGLGLAISQQLALKMGGSITVESPKNTGSEFCLHLPYQQATNPAEETGSISSSKTPISKDEGMRILIAEDEEINFLLLTEILASKSPFITRAYNGQEAVTLAKKKPAPELILMDIKMPVMDGTKAMKQIKQAGINVPVIALTAYAMKEDKQKFLEMGFDDYLSKPVNADLLFKTIDRYHNLR